MSASSSKRFSDTSITDLASEHKHHPTRRKLNSSVPSIVIDTHPSGSEDRHVQKDYQYRGGNYSDSSAALTPTIGIVPSPSSDSNIFCQSRNSSRLPAPLSFPGMSIPDRLSPFSMPRSPNGTADLNREPFNSSPGLSPSGMQLLNLDSGTEMDYDSQTGDDIDWERECNAIELNASIPRPIGTSPVGNPLHDHHPQSLAATEKNHSTQQQPIELCFGMIFATILVIHEMNIEEQLINTGKGFGIYRRMKGYFVLLSPLELKELGLIDLETEECLQAMSDIPSLRLKGHILPPEEAVKGGTGTSVKKTSRKTPTQSGKEKRRITITIYGSHQAMPTVGKILSRKRRYLQEPDHIDSKHSLYQNPHEYVRLESEDEATNKGCTPHFIQFGNTDTSTEDSNLLSTILDSITPRSTLVEDTAADCISTELLSHQKEALCFTRQQESEDVLYDGLWETCQKGSQYIYSHNIINMSQIETPSKLRGGILADEMGLGKTLTMLATIVRSLTEARCLTQAYGYFSGMGCPRLSATLIVLPLSLMAEWENEIIKHIIPDTVRYHKYHAQGKVPLRELVGFDIIFTTYNTLNLEFARGGSPLFNAEWFRVILDEAHHIRNSTTQTFRAVTALSTQRRWCLTGTPTQNRLGDLFSLLMFLKIPHFENKAILKQYIVNLLKVNDLKGVQNLQKLLSACCLRRKKTVLPQSIEVSEIHQLLEMSSAENIRYQKIKDDCNKMIDMQVCSGQSSKAYLSILQSITQLRLICNHGIFQPIASLKGPKGVFHDHVMDVDGPEENAINPLALLELLEMMEQDTCANCDTKIVSLISTHTSSPPVAGYLTRCSHLICAACLRQVLFMTGRNTTEQCCNLCGETSDTSHIHNFDDMGGEQEYPPVRGPFCSPGIYNPDLIVPTKIGALLANIEATPITEKSIVFSGWTKTLDLVETYLRDCKIDLRRVDGKLNAVSRAAIFQDFRENPDVSVLLLTTGCGAAGLNLTAASKIHIMEPQWNPMVEKQAIGRVARLGQSKPVSIYRYIMKATIEESMVSRQFQKTQLAELISGAGDRSAMYIIGSMKSLQELI